MFDRDTHNRLQINNNQANVIKKQIAFFFYIISLIGWSFILPLPIYLSLCGITIIGTVVLHMFPELDDKLGSAADWLSRKWSQLVNSDAELPAQELLLSPSIEHSLIHRRIANNLLIQTT